MNKKLIIAAITLAFAGCSLMPEYHRPEAPVAAAWPQGANADGKRQVAET